jgi:hypothetical protein
MKMKPSRITNSVTRSPLRQDLFFTVLVLACVALSPQVRATCQQGCLTGRNTVLGGDALLNTTGSFNTAIGFDALLSNRTGFDNTALGYIALNSNTNGNNNTAIGGLALNANTIGGGNTANGFETLVSNTTGSFNTANGFETMVSNTTGSFNTATGTEALFSNTTGSDNTAIGFKALRHNNGGDSNIAVGVTAGDLLTTGDDNIDIGNEGVADEAGTVRIGTTRTQTNAYVAGISGTTVPTGVTVIIDTDGHLGTIVSSARFKDSIKPMDKSSEAILALKPVTFRYKKELDPEDTPQFGLVAEDVEKVNPDLVARDEHGKPYTVRYEAVNAMLLNEFLKEHRAFLQEQHKVESLENAMAEQQKENAAMRAMLKEQAAQIQKVSAQLELNKSAPQTVLNNR